MTPHGGRHQHWEPQQAERIRGELLAGYRRILDQVDRSGLGNPGGAEQMGVIAEGAESVVAGQSPTWVPRAVASELRAAAPDSLGGQDLVALSETGFLLFDRPLCATTLGNGGPLGVAPINGTIWWAAKFAGQSFDFCPESPNIVVVHVLSMSVADELPWSPQIWDGSTLSDLGIFVLPVGGIPVGPPAAADDDLAPLVELLYGFGVAAGEFGLAMPA